MIIAVCGSGGHGKDTVSDYIAKETLLRYRESTSEFSVRQIVFPVLSEKYGYKTVQECWDDRRNHRSEWAALIWAYNSESPTGVRLYQEMIPNNDIINGCRNDAEFAICKQLRIFDKSIWVDASKRLPVEDSTSCQITATSCDFVVDNNGTIAELKKQLNDFMQNNCRELMKDYVIVNRNGGSRI